MFAEAIVAFQIIKLYCSCTKIYYIIMQQNPTLVYLWYLNANSGSYQSDNEINICSILSDVYLMHHIDVDVS